MTASTYEPLRVRKLADKTVGERITRFDPETGERMLVNPATPGDEHESWPLAGIAIEGDPPPICRVPTSWVDLGADEGWITLENEHVELRPGGPAGSQRTKLKTVHAFVQADAIVIHTVDGDVRYRVTHQPDKYVDGKADDDTVTDEIYAAGETRVDWFYDLELED